MGGTLVRETDDGDWKTLRIFLIVHFLVWVIVPLFRSVAHFDSIEALAWGLTWEWGTNKHPPLSGWLAEGALHIFRDPDVTLYLLSQTCVVVAMLFVYKLSRQFLSSPAALYSTLFLEGITYYNYQSTTYNVNVLSLALVSVLVFYFHRSVTTGRLTCWLATGLFGGLSLLCKYTNGMVLLTLGAYLLLTAAGRARLKSAGPYLAVLVAAAIFAPHILWLVHYDFAPLAYSRMKANHEALPLAGRLKELLRLAAGQLLNSLVMLLLFVWLYFRTLPESRRFVRRVDPFLVFVAVVPLLVMLGIITGHGIHGEVKWAYALLGYVPLFLFAHFPGLGNGVPRRNVVRLVYVALLLSAAISLGATLFHTGLSTNFTGRGFAARMDEEWRETTSEPMRYVGGDWLNVLFVSTYSEYRPRVYLPGTTVWEHLDGSGLLVVAKDEEDYKGWRQRLPELSEPTRLDIPYKSRFGKEKTRTVYFGIAPPR